VRSRDFYYCFFLFEIVRFLKNLADYMNIKILWTDIDQQADSQDNIWSIIVSWHQIIPIQTWMAWSIRINSSFVYFKVISIQNIPAIRSRLRLLAQAVPHSTEEPTFEILASRLTDCGCLCLVRARTHKRECQLHLTVRNLAMAGSTSFHIFSRNKYRRSTQGNRQLGLEQYLGTMHTRENKMSNVLKRNMQL
jgi:hypothetical protein